jgi:peroxiredoxin
MSDFHNLKANTAQGNELDFSTLKGQVVLIVNVASKCGYTKQYTDLEALYQKYKDRGFTILGFPCNQFLNQEPGTEEEIVAHCKRTYGVSFPIMQKIEVNGDNVHPVYQFLKSQKSGILGLTRIKWNFEKFLVDRNGVVQERYASGTTPSSIDPLVEKLLSQ